jgi:hypothetical protein
VDSVPDLLLLRKSGSAGNRTLDLCVCSQKQVFYLSEPLISQLRSRVFWLQWSALRAIRPMRLATEGSPFNAVGYRRCGVQRCHLQTLRCPTLSSTEAVVSIAVGYRRCGVQRCHLQTLRCPTLSSTEAVSNAVGYRRCGVHCRRIWSLLEVNNHGNGQGPLHL